jgi:hypothetical protein
MPTVVFNLEKTTDQDLRSIAETVKSYAEKFNKDQDDFSINVLFAFDEMLAERIDLLTENGKVGYEYIYQNYHIVEERLIAAGVRLAKILEEIYGR